MTTTLDQTKAGSLETRQERARQRVARLDGTFQSVFEILAEIYRDEDWRYINDPRDNPYTGFTAFVQDRLGCAASNARRYQQGISTLVLPLQQIAAPGTRIPVTSADVARLGVTGAHVVVEEAPAALDGVDDVDDQAHALRHLIDSVAKRGNGTAGFGPIRPSQIESTAPPGALVPAALPPAGGPQLPASTAEDRVDHHGDSLNRANQTEPPEHTPPPEDTSRAAPQALGPTATQPESASRATALEEEAAASNEPTSPNAAAVDRATIEEFDDAVGTLLQSADPVALAEHLSPAECTERAQRCLAAAQKLARVGQLLRSVANT